MEFYQHDFNCVANMGDFVKTAEDFVWIVAHGGTVEIEYDGRMYSRCIYCYVNVGEDEDHEADCDVLAAQEFLGAKWAEHLIEVERIADEHRRHRSAVLECDEKIRCPICHKKVVREGLAQHQKNNVACLEKQMLRIGEENEANMG